MKYCTFCETVQSSDDDGRTQRRVADFWVRLEECSKWTVPQKQNYKGRSGRSWLQEITGHDAWKPEIFPNADYIIHPAKYTFTVKPTWMVKQCKYNLTHSDHAWSSTHWWILPEHQPVRSDVPLAGHQMNWKAQKSAQTSVDHYDRW